MYAADLNRVSRRELLQCGLVGGLSLACPWAGMSTRKRVVDDNRSVVLIVNVGGPSQLDTWDPKPEAPAEVRGPLRVIQTSVPGTFLSQLFPRQARLAHQMALVRACTHTAPARHEIGWQLAETGQAYPACQDALHVGDVVSRLCGPRRGLPAHVSLCAGVSESHSADRSTAERAIPLSEALLARESVRVHEQYGTSQFGQDCLRARCLIEAGVRFVTVRFCADYRDRASWDVHGGPHFADVKSMTSSVGPDFDRAYAALVEDLDQRGLLPDTLVCCVAEFGRTPRINPAGGRDHWPLCWTTTFAGGGVRGGQVIGASDASGAEPHERPVSPAEIVGTIYHSLGLFAHPGTRRGLEPGRVPMTPALRPIEELF